MRHTSWSWAAVAALTIGCGGGSSQPGDAAASPEQSTSALEVENSTHLNGGHLNGISLNGISLNGISLNGRELNGRALVNAHVNSTPLAEVWLEGSALVSRTTSGQILAGAELLGAELGDVEGSSPRLRIDSVTVQDDVWLYAISYRARSGWQPLCPSEENPSQPVGAIPIQGRWDYRKGVEGGGAHIAEPGMITFACTNAALGKCIRFGYKPWRQVVQCGPEGNCSSMSLAAHHQACTRMLRADYCGDGRSFTHDGMLINLYDGAGLQADTENWAIEAEWDAQGARCISQRRLGASAGPQCARDLFPSDCGAPAHFSSGTLIMTEAAPRH